MNTVPEIARRLKSFTLTECLIVMIVGGIVFLGITEGLGLFAVFTSNRSAIMEREQRAYSDLHTLSEIFSVCDSILSAEGNTALFLDGRPININSKEDLVVLTRQDFTDTLFSGYKAKLVLADEPGEKDRMPALKLTVEFGDDQPLEHTFRPRLSEKQRVKLTIDEAEKDYLYE